MKRPSLQHPRVWYGHKLLNPESEADPESAELPFIMRTDHLITREDIAQILGSHYNETPLILMATVMMPTASVIGRLV